MTSPVEHDNSIAATNPEDDHGCPRQNGGDRVGQEGSGAASPSMQLGTATPETNLPEQTAPSGGVRSAPDTAAAESAVSGALDEQTYEALWKMALLAADSGRMRSAQTDGGILGASDFGGCPHKAVLTVRRHPPTDVVAKGKALIGTALHEVFLEQMRALNPDLMIELELVATLPSGRQIPVHIDVFDPHEPGVTDLKTVSDLAYRIKEGVTEQQHQQRNIYGLAVIQAGLATAETLTVRNLYVSMTDATDVWVQQEPFSMDWVQRADEWGEAVAYAVEHDEDGEKTGQPHFCASWCPFVTACKPPLQDASGQLQSPGLRAAVHHVHEAVAQRKKWEKVEKQGKEQLAGISGQAGKVQVVSTWVNTGKGYWRTETKELP
jgi:hypothetical protein